MDTTEPGSALSDHTSPLIPPRRLAESSIYNDVNPSHSQLITNLRLDSSETLSSLRPAGSRSSVIDFFRDENGHSSFSEATGAVVNHTLEHLEPSPLASHPLYRPTTNFSLHSAYSVGTVLTEDNMHELPLDRLCQVIDGYTSLRHAEIVSSEGYKEWTGRVTHRFLVLELCRFGKANIWLRIDRRRAEEVRIWRFLARGATTPANDTARLAPTKDELVGAATRESAQKFNSIPTLGDLRHLFKVIKDELERYELWPANCWFFVSLLQQYLGDTGDGNFTHGNLPYPELASDIRERVKSKMQLYYRLPHPEMIPYVIISSRGDFDLLYESTISQHFDPNDILFLKQFRLVLGLIICDESLPLGTLGSLVAQGDQSEYEARTRRRAVQRATLLLTGTHRDDVPVIPQHPLFLSFLGDSSRSGPFHIDIEMAREEMIVLCFRTMEKSSLFHENGDMGNLDQATVSPELAYACRSWSAHVSMLSSLGDRVIQAISAFFHKHFLSWLKVMGVDRSPPLAALRNLNVLRIEVASSELAVFVRDAILFVQTLPITARSPHIYRNALASVPESSKIFKHYWHFFPDIVESGTPTAPDPILEGHLGPVTCTAFSPDGKTIVSGSMDCALRCWDASSGLGIGGAVASHPDSVTSVVFSPDGNLLATGSVDASVRLWDLGASIELNKSLVGHSDSVRSVAFAPDGNIVVSGSNDYTLRRWNVATGDCLDVIFTKDQAVTAVAYSPDGDHMAAGLGDGSVWIWETKNGIHTQLHRREGPICSVAFSPDGAVLVSGSQDHTLQRWDVTTKTRIGVPLGGHTHSVSSVAFSPNGTCFLSGSYDAGMRLWDTKTGECIGLIVKLHTHRIRTVCFSPSGTHFVSGSHNSIRISNLAQMRAHGERPQPSRNYFMYTALEPSIPDSEL